MTRQITGAIFKSMVISGAAAIERHKSEINELNVFPVPDGDTGTNMSLTMGAGATALADLTLETIGKAADVTAGALLRGARGNSGVILSLLFRGVARHLKDLETADAFDFACAISDGVDSAYKAVMKPAEGTILTVSRLAAGAAFTEAEHEKDIEAILDCALKAGNEALANTININPVLKKAGVVDAGGKGYLYILEGMLRALQSSVAAPAEETAAAKPEPAPVSREKADFTQFETEDIRFAYCTEFIVGRKSEKDVGLLREFLNARGDSIVVVDDDEMIKVHVHSNEPGIILTEALTFGPLLTVKVENMHEQHTGKLVDGGAPPNTTSEPDDALPDRDDVAASPIQAAPAEAEPTPAEYKPVEDTLAEKSEKEIVIFPLRTSWETPEPAAKEYAKFTFERLSEPAVSPEQEALPTVAPTEETPAVPFEPEDSPQIADEVTEAGVQTPAEEPYVIEAPQKEFGVVAVCAGEGMANVFRDLGADNIIFGGQTMNPSTEDILNKIDATPAPVVFVLPNNKNIIMAAQQCMRLTEKKVVVIPTKTMPQGISALIALDAGATIAENAQLMTEAMSRVHTAQITYAARDSTFDGHTIRSGDYLALLEDTLVATGRDSGALVDAIAFSLAQYGPEFITIFYGEDVDEKTAGEVHKRLAAAIPEAETSVVYGGQPIYYFLISAE